MISLAARLEPLARLTRATQQAGDELMRLLAKSARVRWRQGNGGSRDGQTRAAIPIRLSATLEGTGAPGPGPAPAAPPYMRAPSRVKTADAWVKRSDTAPGPGRTVGRMRHELRMPLNVRAFSGSMSASSLSDGPADLVLVQGPHHLLPPEVPVGAAERHRGVHPLERVARVFARTSYELARKLGEASVSLPRIRAGVCHRDPGILAGELRVRLQPVKKIRRDSAEPILPAEAFVQRRAAGRMVRRRGVGRERLGTNREQVVRDAFFLRVERAHPERQLRVSQR